MKRAPSTKVESGFDVVGRYKQDQINGFTEDFLNRVLHLIDPRTAGAILDAMAGDGNLTGRIHEYCREQKIKMPPTTTLERSRVQVEFARAGLEGVPADIVWGDVLTMKNLESGEIIPDGSFDRVVVKSGNHEVPLEKQAQLYASIFRVLKPGGLFVNLGFLFDDAKERDELAEITRIKDRLIGMHAAVANRYFLTREEFYKRLEEAGFVDTRCAMHFDYRIHSSIVQEQYFSKPGLEQAMLELQASQARALTMRRNGRIRFERDMSIMTCPGEITIARRPSWAESNARAFRHCPYDFLRHLECHAKLLTETVEYIPKNAEILDLGCGPGLLAERLVSKKVNYQGFDISPEFVAKCRDLMQKHSNFSFDVGDVMTREIGESRYDALTLLNVLYLPGIDPIKVLRKAFAALKPGGRIIVSGPTSAQSYKLAEPQMRAQLERDGLLEKYEPMFRAVGEANARLLPGQGNYWSIEGMVALLKELGFRTSVANTQIYYGYGFMVVADK